MRRRAFLAAGVATVAGLSGCLQGGESGDSGEYPTPTGDDNLDGYPPAFDEKPKKMDVNPSTFEMYTEPESGVDVPLAPLDVTHNWYLRREARFADARGPTQYQQSHIYGAVLSPAPVPNAPNYEKDPVGGWPKGDRIVCYCGCPHHLSSMRAAELIQNGFENVFVIDEGFWEWHGAGYPIRGKDTEAAPSAFVIDGVTDPASAGEKAWAQHRESGQSEVTNIAEDGTFSLRLKFHDVTPQSTITVTTPDGEVSDVLGDLTANVVRV